MSGEGSWVTYEVNEWLDDGSSVRMVLLYLLNNKGEGVGGDGWG